MTSQLTIRFICIQVIISLIILNFNYLNAQPPLKPNKVDAIGLKQGEWVYLFDKNWQRTSKIDSAKYYRLVSYASSKPRGEVVDYFINGEVQMKADSLISEIPEKYHGEVLIYSKDGNVYQLEYYDKGQMDTLLTIKTFEHYINKYKTEIPNSLDLAYLANDLAYIFREQKRFDLAEPYYLLAKEIREKQLEHNNILIARSCYKLAYVMFYQNKKDEALPLFEKAADIFLINNGNEDENYKNSRNFINRINSE